MELIDLVRLVSSSSLVAAVTGPGPFMVLERLPGAEAVAVPAVIWGCVL